MIFKTLTMFRLKPEDIEPICDQLEERLSENEFKPCAKMSNASRGWLPPAPGSDEFTLEIINFTMFCFCVEKKSVPKQVVATRVEEMIEELKKQHQDVDIEITKATLRDLKEKATAEILAKVFAKRERMYAYIDKKRALLVVDSSTLPRAKELRTHLRSLVGDFESMRFTKPEGISFELDGWLMNPDGNLPPELELGTCCELMSKAKSKVSYTNQDLYSVCVTDHIKENKHVTKLGLLWKDNAYFQIMDNFCIKGVGLHGQLLKENEAEVDGDRQEEGVFENDFYLQANTFNKLFGYFDQWFPVPEFAESENEELDL